jgi:hypothetical protein
LYLGQAQSQSSFLAFRHLQAFRAKKFFLTINMA